VKGDVRGHAQTAHRGPSFSVRAGQVALVQEGGGYARLRIAFDGGFPMPAPGQFLMVRFPWGPALPRALSTLGAGAGWVDLLVKTDGVLREALSKAPLGTRVEMRGPYGIPYAERVDSDRRYALVGGGSGVAPLLSFAATYPQLVASLALGFRSGDVRRLLPGVDLAIEDETGETAEDRLRARWQEGAGVLACGPEPLLARVVRQFGTRPATYVSLETRLGCGFGACRGCTIPTPAGPRRVCVDGPLFACAEVPWLA
jgi:dihydroorotate dehydrogenase electron transfer subunit